MARAFRIDPWARMIEAMSPSTINEKYSEGPKVSATRANTGANAATINVATEPATKEPMAEIARAAPARPCFAIW